MIVKTLIQNNLYTFIRYWAQRIEWESIEFMGYGTPERSVSYEVQPTSTQEHAKKIMRKA
jgi:hypothetical protein